MGEQKRKKRKAAKGRTPAKSHKRDFDQLLDDAIFGVPKKPTPPYKGPGQ